LLWFVVVCCGLLWFGRFNSQHNKEARENIHFWWESVFVVLVVTHTNKVGKATRFVWATFQGDELWA
jgi:hypothetical protein